MISEFETNNYPIQLYDIQMPMTSQQQFENLNSNEVSARKLRVSSQCLILKKKIKHKQKRPSLLKIDETARDIKIYSLVYKRRPNINQGLTYYQQRKF
ncbi:unnamed protein product [Paramecium sonneborni]|uniref:Uncharacterized protein n=1 Tax=Paramecium sonneborni TaxID=65129 RepID=A0A8S1P2M5_9CILI|nr:unnamed protein product [Paramecium sonneborni]